MLLIKYTTFLVAAILIVSVKSYAYDDYDMVDDVQIENTTQAECLKGIVCTEDDQIDCFPSDEWDQEAEDLVCPVP